MSRADAVLASLAAAADAAKAAQSEADRVRGSCTLHLAVDRLSLLPASWLADVSQLEAEQNDARAEAEAIATGRKGATKKGATAASSSSSNSKVPVSSASKERRMSGSGSASKESPRKTDKERAREAEMAAQAERLNSQWRFGLQIDVPLEGGQTHTIRELCSTLEMPPASPPTSPRPDSADGTDSLSRPQSGNSTTNSARGGKVTGRASPNSGKSAGAATGAASKLSRGAKKEEQERAAREAAEQADLAQAKLQARLAARFVPFRCSHSVFLTSASVSQLRATLESGGSGIQVQLWRELVSVEPADAVVIRSRDTLTAVAPVDMRALLKPGATQMSADVPVLLNPEVAAALDAEARLQRERAQAALDAEEHDEKQLSRRSTLSKDKKSARKRDEAAPLPPVVPTADLFAAARSSLSVRTSVSLPLVPLVVKPLVPLSALIPPRQLVPPPRSTPDVQLSEELAAFLAQLAVEYNALAEQAAAQQSSHGSLSAADLDASVASSLLYRLNSSGMFHALKERLKPAMMKLHQLAKYRELPGEAVSTALTFEQRCSRLYADLCDRMQLTLNELFQPNKHTPPTTLATQPVLPAPLKLQPDAPYESHVHVGAPATELHGQTRSLLQAELGAEGPHASTRLAVMAQEAELQGDYARCAVLHQARCELEYSSFVPAASTAAHWYDFACFQLRLNHASAAEAALRHALSIDPTHQRSMLALAGCALESRRDLDLAEVLLRTYAQSPFDGSLDFQARILQGLYAEACEEPEQAAEAYARAADSIGVSGPSPTSPASLSLVSPSASSATAAPAIPGAAPPALIALPVDLKLAPAKNAATSVGPSVWLKGAEYLLGLCLPGLTAWLLRKECASPARSLLAARLSLVRLGPEFVCESSADWDRVSECDRHLSDAIAGARDHGEVVEAFAMRGHSAYQQEKWDEAISEYEMYQQWEPGQRARTAARTEATSPSFAFSLSLCCASVRVRVRVQRVWILCCCTVCLCCCCCAARGL